MAQMLHFARRRGFRSTVRSVAEHLNARRWLRKADRIGTVRLRGEALVKNEGIMVFGDRLRLDGTTVRLEFVTEPCGTLSIGDGTFINYGTNISAINRVEIGRNCNIGQYSIIMDADWHDVENHGRRDVASPIVIGDNVWLGARVIVTKGSRIGAGATIGANSLVRGEIPAGVVAAGSPARVIRQAPPGQ